MTYRRSNRPKGLQSGYLGGDYFEMRECDKDKKPRLCRREGIVTEKAENVARKLGTDYPRMTNSQLRRFFTHARRIERQLQYGRPYEQLRSEIERLIPYAVEAFAKRKVPKSFEIFIRDNVKLALKDEQHFIDGFMVHFEAVVAYFAYLYPKY